MLSIVSIDVGIKHLGIIRCSFDENDNSSPIDVDYCNLINIMEYTPCRDNDCIFHCKEKSIHHRVYHFIKEFAPLFENVSVVLIEAQPLMGLTCVESSLILMLKLHLGLNKHQVKSQSPLSMHIFFGFQNRFENAIDDTRIPIRPQEISDRAHIQLLRAEVNASIKTSATDDCDITDTDDTSVLQSEATVYEFRKHCVVEIARPFLIDFDAWERFERKHDFADALVFVIFWRERHMVDYLVDTKPNPCATSAMMIDKIIQ